MKIIKINLQFSAGLMHPVTSNHLLYISKQVRLSNVFTGSLIQNDFFPHVTQKRIQNSRCVNLVPSLLISISQNNLHCVKSVRIQSYSGPHFPTLELNTERYGVSLRILSKCGKMRTRITPNTDTFCAVLFKAEFFSKCTVKHFECLFLPMRAGLILKLLKIYWSQRK